MPFSQKCCYCNTAGDEPGLIQRLSDSTTERVTCVFSPRLLITNEQCDSEGSVESDSLKGRRRLGSTDWAQADYLIIRVRAAVVTAATRRFELS